MSEPNESKLVYWILGIFAVVISAGISFTIGRLENLDKRVGTLEVLVATIQENTKQVGGLVDTTHKEQMDRTLKFADIAIKINNVENNLKGLDNTLKVFEQRLGTISERVMTINNRLDIMRVKEDKKSIEKEY